MEQKRRPYKYCSEPTCKNTSKSAPDKIFFSVPKDSRIRAKWYKSMKRDKVSPTTCLYCCEDHFELEEDTANYIQYKIMREQGIKVTLRLKKNIIPHKFQCRDKTRPPPILRMGAIKRQRLKLVEEAMSEYALKASVSGSSKSIFCEGGFKFSISNISNETEATSGLTSSNISDYEEATSEYALKSSISGSSESIFCEDDSSSTLSNISDERDYSKAKQSTSSSNSHPNEKLFIDKDIFFQYIRHTSKLYEHQSTVNR